MITKNSKISVAEHIGLFLARVTCPMWVSEVFAITKEAWLMEAPCLEGTPSGWNTEYFQLPQQLKEIGESQWGFSLSRLEVIHGTSAHIKLVRRSHMALPCVVIHVIHEENRLLVNICNVSHMDEDQEFVFSLC